MGNTTLGNKLVVVKDRHPCRLDGDDNGVNYCVNYGSGVGSGGWWYPPLDVGGWKEGVSMAVGWSGHHPVKCRCNGSGDGDSSSGCAG